MRRQMNEICFINNDFQQINNKQMQQLLRRALCFKVSEEKLKFRGYLSQVEFLNDHGVAQHIQRVYRSREFLEESPLVEAFMTKIEKYFMKKPKCTVFMLQTYYKLKEMKIVSPSFKHNMHRKVFHFVSENQQIKNQVLEKMLWFLMENEYEFELFKSGAESHSLKLMEMHEYMNSQLKYLPTWQPYIRISYMLRQLGHQVAIKKQISELAQLQKIQTTYFPFLASFYSKEECLAIQERQQMKETFTYYLTNELILANMTAFDQYLQRLEAIVFEEFQGRQYDTCDFPEFAKALQICIQASTYDGANRDTESQISEIFFRITQNYEVEIEPATRIIDLLINNPNFMLEKRTPILLRSIESLFTRGLEEMTFFPIDGYIRLLELSNQISDDPLNQEGLQHHLFKGLIQKHVWDEGNQQKLIHFLHQNSFKETDEFLLEFNKIHNKEK